MLPTKKFSTIRAAAGQQFIQCQAAGFALINSSLEYKHWLIILILTTEDFDLFEVFAKEAPLLHPHRYTVGKEGRVALPGSGATPSPPMQTRHQHRIPGRFFSCRCRRGRGRRSGESGEPEGRQRQGKSRSEPGIPAAAPGGRGAPGLSQRGATSTARQPPEGPSPRRDPPLLSAPPAAPVRIPLPQSGLPPCPRSLPLATLPSPPGFSPRPRCRFSRSPLPGFPGQRCPRGRIPLCPRGKELSTGPGLSPRGRSAAQPGLSLRKKQRHRRVLRALKGSGCLLPRRGRRKSEAAASVLLRSGVLCTCPGSCSPWRTKRRELPPPCAR